MVRASTKADGPSNTTDHGPRTTDVAGNPGGPSDLQIAAVAHVGKRLEKVRDNLAVGEGQAVDFVVRIKGSMSVAGRQPKSDKLKPDAGALLVHLLEAAGERTRKKLLDQAERAYLASERAELEELETEEAPRVKALLSRLTAVESGTKRGNVGGSLDVQLVEQC